MDVLQIKFKSGNDILVKHLIIEGVEYIFGYPGGSIMPIYDALHRYSEHIFHVLSRHEQGAIHAAQGYSRVSRSRKIGVCIATSGPGATNFITGLADAFTDSTPILSICGQVDSHLLGQNSFQETNIIYISFYITKWNTQIILSQDIGISLQKAFYIANHVRNAPVLIDITKDAQIKKSSFEDSQYKVEFYKIDRFCPFTNIQASPIEISYKLINSSKKPLVLVGQGIGLSNSEEELKKFIEKADLPLASTILGIDVIDGAHHLFMGMLGMHGGYANNLLTNQCDVLIAIGMRFDDRVTGVVNRFARQAKVINIAIDIFEGGNLLNCPIYVAGDCKQNLPIITEKLRKTTKKIWVDLFYKTKKCEEKIIIRDLFTEDDVLSMGELIKCINLYKNKDAILVTDVGQHQMFSSRYFYFSYIKSQVTSAGIGTMGFSIPAAIGTLFASKKRQIICIVGDGGLQMTFKEFGTFMQNKLPIKIILLNNSFLGLVRQWQEILLERRYTSSKLINPNFVQLANSYEIESKKVLEKNLFDKEVKEMLVYTNACFLEVVVEKEDNVFPMIVTGASVDDIWVDNGSG
ncbi:putative acetolactate synthase large subunit [Candidatus Uzinura diaspidicola str. ASNER]|uniref:Acetolactate synthase n=1 Tax=Candidatus Uzinura diaspidicola str. ASNER TaxID=1133592 RepID=L7VN63_9FLAO|nr:putative acetolactate synthase large subunit [Candidatus Uzinura diaspidicola str. ASNER]